jgi:hypothetical protein
LTAACTAHLAGTDAFFAVCTLPGRITPARPGAP